MVHGNSVFIREEAKQARNTHRYTFSMRNFTPFNSVNSLSISKLHCWLQEFICLRDYDMTLGCVTHKSWYLYGAESFMFSQQFIPKLKKCSTIKGPKSSS